MQQGSKRIAIVQSNYIPWKGYFDLIASVDEFVLYDDMQYTRRDWRNRNRIKTPQGLQWISVPVQVKGKYLQTIRETEIAGTEWAAQHWTTIRQNYVRAPHFAMYEHELESLYLDRTFTHLSELNEALLRWVNEKLGIHTTLVSSAQYRLEGDRTEKLLNICLQAGAREYVSGPSARAYMDEQLFGDAGVAIQWFDYPDYPAYLQQWGAFEHGVTVLDVLFNCGPDARRFALCRGAQENFHA